jgi:hypothetical protein
LSCFCRRGRRLRVRRQRWSERGRPRQDRRRRADRRALQRAHERVTSLWARASAVIEGEDAEGRDLRERAEGHFQIIPPDQIALSLGKVGNTNLYFGSDDTFYWWFDMIDSERKIATVGPPRRHHPREDRRARASRSTR